MRRPLLSQAERERKAASQSLVGDFLGGRTERAPRKKPTTRMTAKRLLAQGVADIEYRMKTSHWEGMKNSTWVALHAWCHEQVYGVALAMNKKEYVQACGLAKRRFEDLGSDTDTMIDLIKYAWQRERGRMQWCEDNDKPHRTMSYVTVFSAQWLLNDFKVDRHRKKMNGKGRR